MKSDPEMRFDSGWGSSLRIIQVQDKGFDHTDGQPGDISQGHVRQDLQVTDNPQIFEKHHHDRENDEKERGA
jgi:hypothetical protein